MMPKSLHLQFLTIRHSLAWVWWFMVLAIPVIGASNCWAQPVVAYEPPEWLPRYDLDINIDVAGQHVFVRERVTWTNPHQRPTDRIVFNNHSHYAVPSAELGKLAKTLEFLRLAPSDALDLNGPPCQIESVTLINPTTGEQEILPHGYQPKNDTALEVPLPCQIAKGQSVTLEVRFALRLPQRQGRWGQWRGVTFLAQWLPVVAYYDNRGWRPSPFVPWHQPFCNEAGVYNARITLPCDEVLGSTGMIVSETDLGNGQKQIQIGEVVARDFSLVCSRHFREVFGQAGQVKIRSLHLPGHEHYGREMVKIASEALPVYMKWFGPFPYPQLTIAESYFGWNGNECGGMILIDERVYSMPHLAHGFVDHLLTHEILHQWFYNAVGTDGYAETWMDEGIATYYSHQVMNIKKGKNNTLLEYPTGLKWLPNIHRGDYGSYGLRGCIGRGEHTATVQPMPGFGHLPNLLAMAYDRGGKIIGIIEHRLGKAAMLDFMRIIYRKYYFRVMHVADFQRELEAYTGQSWQAFFDEWLYGSGMVDYVINDVDVQSLTSPADSREHGWLHKWKIKTGDFLTTLRGHSMAADDPVRVVVMVEQRGRINEPTSLGFDLDGSEHYAIRVPLIPNQALVEIPEFSAKIEALSPRLMRVEIILSSKPKQIRVDPDAILVDRQPLNNTWKTRIRWRLTPWYTQLEETDLTNAHDKINVIIGPWMFAASHNINPWFTRSPLFGLRAGVYRTQEYAGGVYLAYRGNDRNIVAGVDGLWDHVPWPNTQIGFIAERSLATLDDGFVECSRAVLYGRYLLQPGSSLYLPPYHYIEAFANVQDRCLPDPIEPIPNSDPFDEQHSLGLHYHKYYLTPYWDPEGGIAIDATFQAGLPIQNSRAFQKLFGQVSTVKYTPDPWGILKKTPALHWLSDTRWAFRLNVQSSLPDDALLYTLGGGDFYRGYDLRERQGNLTWVASVEMRVPIVKGLRVDALDHIAGLRNIYGVAFYDVGNAYINGRELGPTAHAIGGGLRFDVAWFGLIERTMLRVDVAQTINDDTPVQLWFGIQHPF